MAYCVRYGKKNVVSYAQIDEKETPSVLLYVYSTLFAAIGQYPVTWSWIFIILFIETDQRRSNNNNNNNNNRLCFTRFTLLGHRSISHIVHSAITFALQWNVDYHMGNPKESNKWEGNPLLDFIWYPEQSMFHLSI